MCESVTFFLLREGVSMGILEILAWVLAVVATIIAGALMRKQKKMEIEYSHLYASLTLKDQELKRREDILFDAIEKLAINPDEIRDWKKGGEKFNQILSTLRVRLTAERLIVVRMNQGRSIGLPEDIYLVPLTLKLGRDPHNMVGPAPEGKRSLIPPSTYAKMDAGFQLPIELTPLLFPPESITQIDGRKWEIKGEEYGLFQNGGGNTPDKVGEYPNLS